MVRTGIGRRFDVRVISRSGELRTVQAESTPIKDAFGRVISVLGVGRDVTEERATREALREREELLRTIVENAPGGVAIADLEHRLIRANPTFSRLVGYSEAELQGMSVDHFTHEEDRPKNDALYRELFAGKPGPLALEKRFRRKDGTILWVRVTVALARGAKGEPRHTVALVEDLSDRKQKEDHLRLVINTIPAMAWSLFADGTMEFINQRWLEYAGLSFEEALADPTGTMHPEELPGIMEKWSVAMAAGQPYEGEMRLRRADGEYRWFLVRTVPLRDEQGKIVKWYGTSADIEDRQRIADALRESVRVVIDTIPMMAWSMRPDGSVDFVNQRSREYTGLSPEEALEGPGPTVHPEDLPKVMEKWLADMAAGRAHENEMRLRRADGEYRWFLVRSVPLRDEQGNIVKWYGSSIDIDDQKRIADALRESEQALRHSEDRLRMVIDTIPTMAWSLLPDGAVDFVNQRWIEYTGLSLEEALTESSRIVHPGDLPEAVAKWSVVMAAGQAYEDEMRLRRADGEYRWFLVRVVPLRDEQRNIIKWYGTGTDIEDRKRAEEGSRQAAEELQALSRRLVELQETERRALAREMHDRLGETLTALSINLAMLKEAVQGDARASTRVEDSAALVKSTAVVIENMVAELRPPMLDDHGLPAAIDWYARQFTRRTRVVVSVQASELGERPPAEVEMALFRIAQEALTNVAKHARAEHVAIRLSRSPSELVMSIADDGIGLPKSAQAPERPGLGLVTMRERAQAVGGTFKVEALPGGAKAGGGTRLTVRVAL
jgi:PAS domain S-box-containing protein